ncbi:hypothetical protein [Streptomyces sp. SAI-041]|uniref:hypothetical protein n=1 Tax=Streptomyces sp. SAI-041 TaxID=2940548 RepID=UPI0024738C22|nr:hypothetical protein [Streptomyces sp. SAI-041]MDH6546193.1 hypothetical protein [Streptomyces sp. SAI-041]
MGALVASKVGQGEQGVADLLPRAAVLEGDRAEHTTVIRNLLPSLGVRSGSSGPFLAHSTPVTTPGNRSDEPQEMP